MFRRIAIVLLHIMPSSMFDFVSLGSYYNFSINDACTQLLYEKSVPPQSLFFLHSFYDETHTTFAVFTRVPNYLEPKPGQMRV
jgi:hypothetical protein